MQAYQTAKHSSKSTDMVHPSPSASSSSSPSSSSSSQAAIQTNPNPNHPQPTSYPRKYHPGYKTHGMWKWSRHPNFAAEQLFWLFQALFTISATATSGARVRSQLSFATSFAPCLALSILFCCSTFLTEWITEKKVCHSILCGVGGETDGSIPPIPPIDYWWDSSYPRRRCSFGSGLVSLERGEKRSKRCIGYLLQSLVDMFSRQRGMNALFLRLLKDTTGQNTIICIVYFEMSIEIRSEGRTRPPAVVCVYALSLSGSCI